MTDAEIIKALECCCIEGNCKACPFHNASETDCGECIRLIQIHSHNLILRLKKMVVETDKTEDEILKKLLTQRVEFIPNSQDVEDIKRKTVREFTERLKARFAKLEYKTDTHRKTCSINQLDATVNWVISEVTSMEIDKLVSEMFPKQKGEENGHRKN